MLRRFVFCGAQLSAFWGDASPPETPARHQVFQEWEVERLWLDSRDDVDASQFNRTIRDLQGLGSRAADSAWTGAEIKSRRLATIDGQLPSSGIALRLSIGGVVSQIAVGLIAQLYAGQTVQVVELRLTAGDTFVSSASAARLKYVLSSVTRSTALSGACTNVATSLGLSSVNQPFADTLGATAALSSGGTTLGASLSGSGLVFKMGGVFKICYSRDGSFGTSNTDILDVTVSVDGVYDSCTTTDCLAKKRYNCYALKDAGSPLGSCTVSFSGIGQGYQGGVGKVSWSAAWTPSWNSSTGGLLSLGQQACGTTGPDTSVFCPQGSTCQGSDRFIEPEASTNNTEVVLPRTQNISNVSAAYSLAACYCPNLAGCDAISEFVQQIGILYVFTSKVCDFDEVGLSLASSPQNCISSAGFTGVAPRHPFSLIVNCAPGACPNNDTSRIKLVDAHANNNKPSWDTQHGCHSANQTALQSSPNNCASSTSCTSPGGIRQDRKFFGDNSSTSFHFDIVGSDYESHNFHSPKGIDICFCTSSCTIATNWFKVGSMVYSPYRLLNLYSSMVSTVNVPGKLGLYRSAADTNSVGLSVDSLIKILWDPLSSATDTTCRNGFYNITLVPKFTHADATAKYQGKLSAGDTGKIIFDSGVAANTYTIVAAGIVAICYCRLATCTEQSSEWIFAARYVIQGPVPNQVWTFSTGLAVRITYQGYGLNSSAKLRVIPTTVQCSDFTNNPHTETSLQVGCPHSCTQMSSNLGVSRMNLATQLLTHASVRCGVANTQCETVYVNRVVVLNATRTEVEFTGDPGLSTGDRLMLTAGILCSANCDVEQVAEVSGRYSFGNSGTYDIGHLVTATADVNKFTIPVGWAGSVPAFDVFSGQGEWQRTNYASTAEELKGTAANTGLKLCWGYKSDTYVFQLGTVTFEDPPSLTTSLSLTTQKKGAMARVIISLATGVSRSEYAASINSMQLKIVFTDVNRIEPHFTNGVVVSAVSGWDEQDLSTASQPACGKIFHEMWSTNDAAGFPTPMGCYFRIFSNTRELFILFDKKNPLRAGKTYQLVLSATAKASITAPTDLVRVFSMDDVVLNPYKAVEAGNCAITRDAIDGPTIVATGSTSRFADQAGLSIISGTNSLVQLTGSLDFQFRLAGHASAGIVKSSILRLYMWPLTQWNMVNSVSASTACTATCTPYIRTQCGGTACKVEAVETGVLQNVVKLDLPSDMTTAQGNTKHVFRVTGLTLPSGGFFASRIGAQISTVQDTNPDYTVSSGDYLWKVGSTQQTIGELVVAPGDGNSMPFKGGQGNVLHVHLVLGATLFADGLDGYASLSVRMPPGYVCTQVSATPSTLSIFNSVWGRGTLNTRQWVCSGNNCTYMLDAYGVIFAGSSLYVSFTVNNPSNAMPRSDASNKWYVGIQGAGQHTTAQVFPDVPFQTTSTSSTSFSTNVSVLGLLTNIVAQPSNFTITGVQTMSIFFQTEQSAGFVGYVVIAAPLLFDFGSTCSPGNLAASYYRAKGANQVYPLPQISSCSGTTSSGSSNARNIATIRVVGHLRAGRHYAFQIGVTNPSSYDVLQQSTWYLWTKTSQHDYVDGTRTSLDFQLNGTGDITGNLPSSWGMYSTALRTTGPDVDIAVQVAPLLPYSVTNQEATITFFPLKSPVDVDATLRISAPHGYVWFFSDSTFIYKRYVDSSAPGIVGATADLPGKVPQKRHNVIEWPKTTYLASHTYGFFTAIRVPDHTPIFSSNVFFIEFGYDDKTWGAQYRTAAAALPATPVRALCGAEIAYTTRIKAATNTIRFTIETATMIPLLGGLLIIGPKGFVFSETCLPVPAGSAVQALPNDVACDFTLTSAGEAQLSISAASGGIPAGLYDFEITGTNPLVSVENQQGENTICGSSQCWTFYSVETIKDGLASVELDKRLSITGFAITDQMLSAMLLPLDEATRASSGRDDTPLQQNWLTFTFQLGYDVIDRSFLTIRGPAGFVFTEDCLVSGGVRTLVSNIFGSSTGLMQGHSAWEPNVPVLACDGDGSMAKLDIGAGLKRLKSYVFSIRVSANPSKTPAYNKWTIETVQESSAPFDGFILWTFTQTFTRALSTAVATATPVVNLVNVTFRPYNDLNAPTTTSGGVLMLTAPSGFQFVSGCTVHLEESDPLWPTTAPVVFPSTAVTCLAGLAANKLGVVLSGSNYVLASRHYTLMVRVYNPSTITSAQTTPPTWELKSYQDSTLATAYDTATIAGFATNKPMNTWMYSGSSIENGGVQVDNLLLTMVFPDMINIMDQLLITAPLGYDLSAPTNQVSQTDCNNAIWGPGNPAPITYYSRARCVLNSLIIVISEDNPISNATTITLRITTTNPPTLPNTALNYWHARHANSVGATMSSAIFQGWQIVPQLQQVRAAIVGSNLGAGSTTELEFRFVAVGTAASINILAVKPSGFDFGQSLLPLTGQVLIDAVQNLIRANVAIVAGNLTTVRVSNVKLAQVGGQTEFDIRTFAVTGATGSVVDQKIGFKGGFRLAGSITVSNELLQSEYALTPSLHPITSSWPAQLGQIVYASFSLKLSNSVGTGNTFRITCPSYSVHRTPFSIIDLAAGAAVPVEVSYVSGSELRAILLNSLQAQDDYRLSVKVTAPSVRPASDIWTLEVIDGSTSPLAHTFLTLTNVLLVANFGLSVTAPQSPPSAEVEVSLLFVLGSARPTLLTLIAPQTFIFKANCLVVGGTGITSCQPGFMTNGRPTADLTCIASGLTNTVQNVKIFVTTPPIMPADRTWYVEGTLQVSGSRLGWGQDITGVTISPMQDVSADYIASPNVASLFAMQFRTSQTINRGGKVNVMVPHGFAVNCAGNALYPISLPGVVECATKGISVNLTLNDTVTPGQYGFAFTVQTPNATPALNVFSLLLRDERGKVQDSAMNLPGATISQNIVVIGTPLRWSSSAAGQSSSISIGFTANQDIANNLLGALLITLPENFGHAIENANNVVSRRGQLPLKSGTSSSDWLDYSLVDRLIILLDPSQSITAGDYEFEFPVTVPDQMPAYNVWMLTLCQYSSTSVCVQSKGSLSLVTIPFAGFSHGQTLAGSLAAGTQGQSVAYPAIHRDMISILLCINIIIALSMAEL